MKKNAIACFLCFILVLLDQITKYFADIKLNSKNDKIILGDFLQLHYLENKGAAFGILNNKRYFFIILTVFFCIIFIYLFIKIPKTRKFNPLWISSIFVFSGAIGNFIDRIRNGYVIDFFYVKIINFPVFNVADIYITVSCISIILLFLFYYNDDDFEKIFPKSNKITES